jgi:hypothetical protein
MKTALFGLKQGALMASALIEVEYWFWNTGA